jgi:hypothetical protein
MMNDGGGTFDNVLSLVDDVERKVEEYRAAAIRYELTLRIDAFGRSVFRR